MHGGRIRGLWRRVPARCEVCGTWPSHAVCDACVARFAAPRARCLRCALPLEGGAQACARCLASPPPLQVCVAAVDYEYPWAGMIGEFKFQSRPGWASTLAALMASAPWVEPALERADQVVPMPLGRGRLAERGFNQAHELARRLAPEKVRADLLLRLRETRSQAELTLADRQRNMEGAFAVAPEHVRRVRGLQLLLVDDVMTTGASLHAAARALLQAGAAGVSAVVLARTPEPSDRETTARQIARPA